MMKRLLALALLALAPYSANAFSMPPEYKACHAGDRAACKKWRDRECRKASRSSRVVLGALGRGIGLGISLVP